MQIGLMSVRDTDACLFTVSDQPWLEADTVVALTELFENEKREWPVSDGMERLEIPAFLDRNITKN